MGRHKIIGGNVGKSSTTTTKVTPGVKAPRNPSHSAKNVTPADRVREFGDIVMLDDTGKKLLCWACGYSLDHTRRSTIVEHLRSRKHNRSLLLAQAMKNSKDSVSQITNLDELKNSTNGLEKGLSDQISSFLNHQLWDFGENNTGGSFEIKLNADLKDINILEKFGTTQSMDSTQHPSSNIQEPNIEIDTNVPPEESGEGGSKDDAVDSHTLLPDGSTDAELSGLCLVKRQIHCYSVLDQLMRDDTYTDVTISTDGHTFKAHKIVLCMASNYFKRVLNDNTPGVRNVIVLRDITTNEMKNVLQFIYTGEATLDASDLQSFMKTAQLLEINSLCDNVPQIPKTSSNKSSDIQALSSPQPTIPIPTNMPSNPSTLAEVPQLPVPPIPNADSFPSTLFQPQYQYYIQQHLKRRIEAFARQTIENNLFENGYVHNTDTLSNGHNATENESPLPLTCKMKTNAETKDNEKTLENTANGTVENGIPDSQSLEENEEFTAKDEIIEPEHTDQLTEENCLDEISDQIPNAEESLIKEELSPPSKKRKVISDD